MKKIMSRLKAGKSSSSRSTISGVQASADGSSQTPSIASSSTNSIYQTPKSSFDVPSQPIDTPPSVRQSDAPAIQVIPSTPEGPVILTDNQNQVLWQGNMVSEEPIFMSEDNALEEDQQKDHSHGLSPEYKPDIVSPRQYSFTSTLNSGSIRSRSIKRTLNHGKSPLSQPTSSTNLDDIIYENPEDDPSEDTHDDDVQEDDNDDDDDEASDHRFERIRTSNLSSQSLDGLDSPTVKDVQEAINISHPFGLKIWKPALYQKSRSIDAKSYQAVHSTPGAVPNIFLYLSPGNLLWSVLFGWWIALLYIAVATFILCPFWFIGYFGCVVFSLVPASASSIAVVSYVHRFFLELHYMKEYALVLYNLSGYMFWPFGKFIAKRKGYHMIFQQADSATSQPEPMSESSKLLSVPSSSTGVPTYGATEHNIEEEHGSVGTLESHVDETERIFTEHGLHHGQHATYWMTHGIPKVIRRLWHSGLSGIIGYLVILTLLAPVHFFVSGVCFLFVFPVPMSKLNYVLMRHLLRHPLQLSAHDSVIQPQPQANTRQAAGEQAPDVERGGASQSFPPEAAVTNPAEPVSYNGPAKITTDANSGLPIQSRPRSVFIFRPDSMVMSDTTIDIPYLGPEIVSGSNVITSIVSQTPVGTPFPTQSDQNQQTHMLTPEHHIVLCTYHAMGWEYYKYTVDGINIIFINLVAMVAFTLFDFYVIGPWNGYKGVAAHGVIFGCGLLSIIPLAYFIGMAVSSITAHTGSVAIGSVINATFGSIIEIILYVFGLIEGKTQLVEGALIGSFLCGLLALPGVSMFFGGLMRKEQKFNAKSANITSTLLVIAVIGAFTPTIFQSIYGSVEIHCNACGQASPTSFHSTPSSNMAEILGQMPAGTCRSCRMFPSKLSNDPVYLQSTKPLMYICAAVLVLTYAVGLCFTLGTHAHRIYPSAPEKSKRRRHLSRRSGHSHLRRDGSHGSRRKSPKLKESTPNMKEKKHITPPFIAQDVTPALRPTELTPLPPPAMGTSQSCDPRLPRNTKGSSFPSRDRIPNRSQDFELSSLDTQFDSDDESPVGAGGHDHPNWSVLKSGGILLVCTILYSMLAEVLIACLDDVLEVFPLTEKTLGLTIFAIVPTVTEFYNAIAFAMQGNIVLSLEIGSAYAIQIAFLQIPVLVAFSALWHSHGGSGISGHGPHAVQDSTRVPFQFVDQAVDVISTLLDSGKTPVFIRDDWKSVAKNVSDGFTLVFPKLDFYAVLFGVFLLTYIYIEGKSNYFKGAILLLSYFVLMFAFFFEPPSLSSF